MYKPHSIENYKHILSIAGIILFLLLFVKSAFIYFIAIIVLLVMTIKNFKIKYIIFIASTMMALLAFNKELVGDLRVYSLYYDFAGSNTLTEALFNSRSDFSIRRSEPIFRIYNWAASTAGVDFRLYHAFTIWMSYMLMLNFGIKYASKLSSTAINPEANKNIDQAFSILWVLLVSISFTLTSQVMRQYLSIGLFSYGLGLYLDPKKNKIFILPLLMAVLVHNATIFLLLLLLINQFIYGALSKTIIKIVVLAFAFIFGSIVPLLLGPLSSILSYNLEEVNLGLTVIIDSSLVVGLLIVSHSMRYKNKNIKYIVSFTFLIVGMIVFFREVPILLLRLYFYMDIVRIIAGISIYRSLTKNVRVGVLIFCVLLAPVYWTLKLYSSGWDYGWYTENDLIFQILER